MKARYCNKIVHTTKHIPFLEKSLEDFEHGDNNEVVLPEFD
jgi:hypothetical protein